LISLPAGVKDFDSALGKKYQRGTSISDLACRKPKDLGYAAELWTLSALARHVCAHASGAGFERLSKVGKTTVWRILDANELKPHRVRYYLERRDPQFEQKMAEVLMVYRDVNLFRADAVHDGRPAPIYTLSVDEKPGVQAIGLTAPDLSPVANKHASRTRLRVCAAWNLIHPGRVGPAYWRDHRQHRSTSP
jgi:hypothetical protein